MFKKGDQTLKIAAQTVICNAGLTETVALAGKDNFDKSYLEELKQRVRSMRTIWIHAMADRPFTEHPGILTLTRSNRVKFTICPTNLCPELAPPGKHLLNTDGRPEPKFGPVDWEREIGLCIQDIRDNFPEFNRSGKVLLIQIFQDEWPGCRSWPGYMMPQHTPIRNLFNVGDGVVPEGMSSSQGVAAGILKAVDALKMQVQPA